MEIKTKKEEEEEGKRGVGFGRCGGENFERKVRQEKEEKKGV